MDNSSVHLFVPCFFTAFLYDIVCFLSLSLSSAEKFLESVEVNQNYPVLLLHLVDKQDVHLTIRVAGAVAFKNYIKRNWKVVSTMCSLLISRSYTMVNSSSWCSHTSSQ